MSEYAKRYYGVPSDIGRIVIYNGRTGVISADRGHYIGVTFDDEKPGVVHNFHPCSDGLSYHGMGNVRPMTRSQARYAHYLEVSDLFDSFRDYLVSGYVKQ